MDTCTTCIVVSLNYLHFIVIFLLKVLAIVLPSLIFFVCLFTACFDLTTPKGRNHGRLCFNKVLLKQFYLAPFLLSILDLIGTTTTSTIELPILR